ncbi:MAG TPA: DUF4124 domain-containing protein [Myxococcaceae bacterium]|jgi:hypothetical protein|nr:DUF4124 domain-containing protein [Myxococcaceae bacterium]
MRRASALVSLLALLLCRAAAAQQMLSWTDKHGVVHYTDDPSSIPKDAQSKVKKTSGGRIDTVKKDVPSKGATTTSNAALEKSRPPQAETPASRPVPTQAKTPSGPAPEEIRLEQSIAAAERTKRTAQPAVGPSGSTWTPEMEARLRAEKAELQRLQAQRQAR